jgi:uncharacterized protein YjiS (DUF1127 family)
MIRIADQTRTPGRTAGEPVQARRPDTADVTLQARQMQAEALAATTRVVATAVARLAGRALRPLRRRWRALTTRRRTIAALRGLDARALADIGVDPNDIEGSVDRALAGRAAQQAVRTTAGQTRQPQTQEVHRLDTARSSQRGARAAELPRPTDGGRSKAA